jgi:hypothetical protein
MPDAMYMPLRPQSLFKVVTALSFVTPCFIRPAISRPLSPLIRNMPLVSLNLLVCEQ